MVSEREQAKGAIVDRQQIDPEFEDALTSAHNFQLQIEKEKNRHAEAMRGWFGRVIGDPQNAPVFIALIALIVGLGVWVVCLFKADSGTPAVMDFYSRWAERALALASSALAYIFGKGLKSS